MFCVWFLVFVCFFVCLLFVCCLFLFFVFCFLFFVFVSPLTHFFFAPTQITANSRVCAAPSHLIWTLWVICCSTRRLWASRPILATTAQPLAVSCRPWLLWRQRPVTFQPGRAMMLTWPWTSPCCNCCGCCSCCLVFALLRQRSYVFSSSSSSSSYPPPLPSSSFFSSFPLLLLFLPPPPSPSFLRLNACVNNHGHRTLALKATCIFLCFVCLFVCFSFPSSGNRNCAVLCLVLGKMFFSRSLASRHHLKKKKEQIFARFGCWRFCGRKGFVCFVLALVLVWLMKLTRLVHMWVSGLPVSLSSHVCKTLLANWVTCVHTHTMQNKPFPSLFTSSACQGVRKFVSLFRACVCCV